MDRNLVLAFTLSIAVVMIWTLLQPPPVRQPPTETPDAEDGSPAPEVAEGDLPTSPLVPPPPREAPPQALVDTTVEIPEAGEGLTPLADAVEQVLEIETPLYSAELTSRGAALPHWALRRYTEGPRRGDRPIVLTTGQPPLPPALVTPFVELGLGDLTDAVFGVERENGEVVTFQLRRAGVTIRKTYTFVEDSYHFRLRVDVDNESAETIAPQFAVYWPAHMTEGPDFVDQALAVLHDGSVGRVRLAGLGRGGLFGSLTGRKPQAFHDYPGEISWAGVQTNYFLGVLLPDSPTQASARFVAVEPGESGVVQLFFQPVQLPPGRSAAREFRVYIGPKEAARLTALGGGLVRSIDLGWSWISWLTPIFTSLLAGIYSIVPNYGVAIIILTILVRVVTAPLTTKQMRSMERMRGLAPKLKEIQEKYKDDRQKQSEETMSLYRKEKVNPLGGCLPMILQLPVFIGLFYALRSSIYLRQQPFFGWIDDLSSPEELFAIPGVGLPVRVLPLAMGATMVLQQKIAPMSSGAMDPNQMRMMMIMMPVVMTFVFYRFASGLVLYWMVSSVLAILHQLWIGRRMRAKG